MSIASEITRIKTNISNAYTKLEEKGATIPEAKNSENLTACIDSVSVGGGGSTTKYGVSIGNYLGDVDENGALQKPSESFEFVATGVENVGVNALYKKFGENGSITKASFPDLTTITGAYGLKNCFDSCTNLTSVDLSNLTSINATEGLYYAFYKCTNLTEVKLDNLTTIQGKQSFCATFYNCSNLTNLSLGKLTTISGANACDSMFVSCINLTNVDFSELTTIDGSYACRSMFSNCTGLTSVSFPKLTTITNTNALGNSNTSSIFYNCTNITEIHFRADMQSVIEGLASYQYNFGATKATIYFDL